ncbi:heterokaryon incompatibility protein-domain-containing protein [Xylaria telfairii]|nr:heterokaryon incompatibility protein-domain-containing protein [Xylaria telfairii]
MRLINTTTLELEDHFQTIPQYAILSHTWGGEEVSLQDWLSSLTPARRDDLLSLLSDLENPAYGSLLSRPFCELAATHKDRVSVGLRSHLERFGYWKIIRTCLEARKDGLNYLWVDTNCIDKTSSAELSEAINSMYTWYRNSAICYAYLSDVIIPEPADTATCVATEKSIINLEGSSLELFRRSRWFRRGWTLQELLAPMKVRFYSRNWTPIGTKKDMAPLLAEITRVDERFLRYTEDIRSASVAQRMAAVADRTTTRPEDIAYCLLGLFNVNMPLLYGEGAMAFVRLQEEIMKVSDDHSIFAWTWMAELNGRLTAETPTARRGRRSLDYKPNFPANRIDTLIRSRMRRDAARPTLLALDPACFFNSNAVPTLKPSTSLGIFTMTNVGLSISLPILTHPCMKLFFGVIHDTYNTNNDTRTVIMIPLIRHYRYPDRWTRASFPIAPVTVEFRSRSSVVPKLETIQVCRDIQPVPFYFDAFGGTSHRFGFWLLFPQVQETRHLQFRLVDGCVLGDGVYNIHGLFLDPDPKRWSQIIGGLLVYRVDASTQDTWHETIIILFLVLGVKKTPNNDFEKTSCHCRISVRPRAPVDAPHLLEEFVASLQKHLDDGGQSTYTCVDNFKKRHKNSSPLIFKDLTLHASAECLNDEALSHSSQSEITLTDLKLWHSENRITSFKQFARSLTI